MDMNVRTTADGALQPVPLRSPALFSMQRLGMLVEPAPDDHHEAWGILNPGAARARDGRLYLFPRVIAEGNYSRIALAQILFDAQTRPAGIERLGYVLEPTAPYEQNTISGGGCEDARVSYLRPLDKYVMTYTALTPLGPRIALAISDDLFTWQRLGLIRFARDASGDFSIYDNKDGLFFPDVVKDGRGRLRLALLHRPAYRESLVSGKTRRYITPEMTRLRESIWLSYASLEAAQRDPKALTWMEETHLLAVPEQSWENCKIGGGTPPVLTRHGWLLVYHGVSGCLTKTLYRKEQLIYRVGVMMLDRQNPRVIRYRSRTPVMEPELALECEGLVRNVIFPTGIDPRPEPGDADGLDVYYGMADKRIGVARLRLPARLPGTNRLTLVK